MERRVVGRRVMGGLVVLLLAGCGQTVAHSDNAAVAPRPVTATNATGPEQMS